MTCLSTRAEVAIVRWAFGFQSPPIAALIRELETMATDGKDEIAGYFCVWPDGLSAILVE
jgi:hypothetical protein